jgi:bacterioferritin
MSDTPGATGIKPFLSDIKALRDRAHRHMTEGVIARSYGGSTECDCRILNEALATEIVCIHRYKRHCFMAKSISSEPLRAEFLQYTVEEQGHADRIAKRIIQLGGSPNFLPDDLLSRSRSERIRATVLREMMLEDLAAERIAIENYQEMVSYFAPFDPITCQLIVCVKASEEAHSDDLVKLLEWFPPQGEARARHSI